ncbi:MAG: DUF1059 domain-containing protein [Candidatus Thermoplasmatota archaeon]|nr:DUF1059 domain-containing protein [Candidatus Thermoplasmatota archaeon]
MVVSKRRRRGILPSFRCRDIGLECDFEAKAWTRGSLIKKIKLHATEAHDMHEIQSDLLDKIMKAIR